MKFPAKRIFLWSFLITIPINIFGSYRLYRTVDRFVTFNVRYDPAPIRFHLTKVGKYESDTLIQRFRAAINHFEHSHTNLEKIHLFVSHADLSRLNARLPHSGYQYMKARLFSDGKLNKVKIKYRGDYVYHWGFDKKSLRIKTSKKHLFKGLRSFNLLSPKFDEQLNNFLAYRLAEKMGLIAPRTELIRLFINGEDRGVYVLAEQVTEMTLRNRRLMPADIYRGELVGKDAYSNSHLDFCEIIDGSGVKEDLFEYSGMLSIHDADHIRIKNCRFRNSHIVDDMVHAVYATINFENTVFENAYSDALDLDMSKASIRRCRFEHSGNDAVDLMTTDAYVLQSVFHNNGDKGISVGEGSELLAIDNRFTENSIGIQVKDGSLAALFNQTLEKNGTALHAYQKNWQYSTAGLIFAAKSAIGNNKAAATADQYSTIQLFDSYIDIPTGKKINAVAVDNYRKTLAQTDELLPNADL